MKKILAAILTLTIISLCVGCGQNPPEQTQASTTAPTIETQPEDTSAPTQPHIQYDIPFTALSCPAVTMDFTDDLGNVVLHYTCQNLELTTMDAQVANTILLDYLNLVDYESGTAEKVLRQAKEAADETGFTPHTFSILYAPQRLDSEILSLYGTQIIDKNTTKHTTNQLSVTYDMITGRSLTLKDVLTPDFSADTLSQQIVASLANLSQEGILYSDYAYVISQMFSTNTPVNTWYLSDIGLCFYFVPYEIAPYSAGTIIAQIPYQQLNGLLREQYFPAEQEELVGEIQVSHFHDADLNTINQFCEVILDSTAQEYLITAQGGVRNVRIQQGVRNSDGVFIPHCTILAAATLTSTDGIVLQADIGPDLQISYEMEGQCISLPLSDFLS